jgi:hypothetical protein
LSSVGSFLQKHSLGVVKFVNQLIELRGQLGTLVAKFILLFRRIVSSMLRFHGIFQKRQPCLQAGFHLREGDFLTWIVGR